MITLRFRDSKGQFRIVDVETVEDAILLFRMQKKSKLRATNGEYKLNTKWYKI